MKNKVAQEILKWLDEETSSLKKEIDNRNETVSRLHKLSDELMNYDSYAAYKDKYEEISQLYEKEKERLIKLHEYYKKMESECESLRIKVKGWQEWFNSNKNIFEQLFSEAPPVSISEPTKSVTAPPTKKQKKKTKIKKRKKSSK